MPWTVLGNLGYGDFQAEMTSLTHHNVSFCITELNSNWVAVLSKGGVDETRPGRVFGSGLRHCGCCLAASDLSLGLPEPFFTLISDLLLTLFYLSIFSLHSQYFRNTIVFKKEVYDNSYKK